MSQPSGPDTRPRPLLLRGGVVADGIGTHTRQADILIDGPLIRWIGTGNFGRGDHEVLQLDPGSVICPGFVDAHVHAETPLFTDGRVDGALAQGVTTLVVGQDGTSWIGAQRGTVDYLNRYFAAVNGPIPADCAMPVAEFARHVNGQLSQNVAVVASHGTMRGNGPRVRAGLIELIAVGRRAAVRVHASHLWGSPNDLSDAYRAADRYSVQLSHDMYPYRRSSTILAASLLPKEVQAGGPEATIARLRDPAVRADLHKAPTLCTEVLDTFVLGHVPDAYADDVGLSITTAAARHGEPPGDWILSLLAEARLVVSAHRDRPPFTDEQLRWILDHEHYTAGSDGIYLGQCPHPRGYGTFARLARRYLAQGPERGYQLLARHAAANPAAAYGLTRRGRLAPGLAADIAVIAPGGLHDRATYEQPKRLAGGIALVFVNGTIVGRSGNVVPNSRPGAFVSG